MRIFDNPGRERRLLPDPISSIDTHRFHGWGAEDPWDDIRLAAGHYAKVERIALVG